MADRSVFVRLKADISDFQRGMVAAGASAKTFSSSLDTSSDRMGNLVQSALALGPALVPIGAAAVPAVAGLTNQLGFAAAGAGVAALAFTGIGDALKSVNDYSLAPTTANLQKMNEAMATLGPAGQQFVQFLQKLRPDMQALQDSAQAGLFPGVEAGLTSMLTLMPKVEGIITKIASAMGDLAAEAGEGLASDKWASFFAFIDAEARPTLMALGKSIGNVALGFANLWQAFAPLSNDFSASMLQMSRSFAAWTDGLAATDGFQNFVQYIRDVGPTAWATLGSLANALLQIVEAAAPVGQVLLPVIKTLADGLAAVADSPVGPVLIGAAAGISAISRAVALYKVANGSALTGFLANLRKSGGAASGLEGVATAAHRAEGGITAFGKSAGGAHKATKGLSDGAKVAGAGMGILALSMTDLDDKLGVSNTATLALLGSFAGPWGAALGAGAGAVIDVAHANDTLADSMQRADAAVGDNTVSLTDQKAAVQGLADQLQATKDATDTNWDTGPVKGFKSGLIKINDLFTHTKDHAESELDELKNRMAQAPSWIDTLGNSGLGQSSAAAQKTATAFSALGDSASTAADQASALNDALNAMIDPSLDADKAALAAKQGWDSLKKTLKDTGGAFEDGSRAGLKSSIAIKEQAKNTIDAATAQFQLDGNTRKLTKSLLASKDRLIDVGTAAGIPKKAMKALANQMFDVPKLLKIAIKESGSKGVTKTLDGIKYKAAIIDGKVVWIPIQTKGAAQAMRDLINAQNAAARLNGTTSNIYINTIRQSKNEDMMNKADGGLITGPGGPREDKIPARLSNGEFVVNAAATSRHRALLESINAQKFANGGPVGFASGGFASASMATGTGTSGIFAGVVPAISALTFALVKNTQASVNLEAAQTRQSKAEDKVSGITKSSHLDVLQQQQSIKDLRKQLNAKGDDRLKGIDRKVAKAQLNTDLRDLKDMKNATKELTKAKAELAAANKAVAQAQAASDIMGTATIDGLTSTGAVDRYLQRTIANIGAFSSVLAGLKSKGAPNWLLQQLQSAGPTTTAIKLGKQYLSDPVALARLKGETSMLAAASNDYGTLTSASQFSAAAAWSGAPSSLTKSVQVQIQALDMTEFSTRTESVVRHVISSMQAQGAL